MTRAMLSLSLCGLCLLAGLATCLVQCANHARADDLARAQREWQMLSAANAQSEALVQAHVWGVPLGQEWAARRPRAEPAP
jgi:hypothetical protein